MKAKSLIALLFAVPALAFGAEFQRPVAPIPGLGTPLNVLGGEALRAPVINTPVGPLVPSVLPLDALALPQSLVPAEALLPPAAAVGAEIGPLAAPASAELGSRRDRRGDDGREALRAIEDWSAQQREPASRGDLAGEQALGGKLFDAARVVEPAAASGDATLPRPLSVILPRGVESVSVEEVGDETVGRHLVYVYHTRQGDVRGVDLRSRPELVDTLPDLQPQERVAIKKIQAYTKDLRVLVLESAGKTPDLEVAGVITELKSWPIDVMDLTHIVNRANSQVGEHAERHGGLGKGAVAVDILGRDRVPVAEIERELNAWAAMPVGTEIRVQIKQTPRYKISDESKPKEPLALDRVTFFAGDDVKVFQLGKDGAYRLLPSAVKPFDNFAVSGHRPIRRAAPTKVAPASSIGDAYEKARILSDLRGFRERGRGKRAFKSWERFQRTHRPEVVAAVRAQAEAILERILKDAAKRKGRRG